MGWGRRRGGGCLRRVRDLSSGSVSSVSVGGESRGDMLRDIAPGAPATSLATDAWGARATLAPSTASKASPARNPALSAGPPAATAETTQGLCPAIVNPKPPTPRATTSRRSETRGIAARRRRLLCCWGTIAKTLKNWFSNGHDTFFKILWMVISRLNRVEIETVRRYRIYAQKTGKTRNRKV